MLENTQLETVLHKIYPGTSTESLDALSPCFTLQTYPRGTAVLRQGENWGHALLIESGLVRMHFLRNDGREFNKNFFTENQLLCPLTPLMISSASLFGITCIEASRIWRCPMSTFTGALSATEWLHVQHELLIRLLDSKLQREHDLLALNSRQRYQKFCEHNPGLAQRIPLTHLATYLGLTDVSLSRLRRQLGQT